MLSEHAKLEELFSAALELENPAERTAFLAQACADNSGLRQRVEKLLSAHQQASSFLSTPAVDPDATVESGSADTPIEERIGPYRIVREIGEGGFGSVYLAEQDYPVRRSVAIKVIKLGMDTRQVIARFEAERQALAMMDHPNIARVLEAGSTASGRPYFVMELVRGVPITEYCDKNRLSIEQRLQLFLPVCNAVHHAHQKGIVHRDIKPGNILVMLRDNEAIPKVIDFGIAKAVTRPLTERPADTGQHQFLGTPEYMSPDQADDALDIDTRTDIYSLGAVLYELLTGGTPLDLASRKTRGPEEIRRVLREVDPQRPSERVLAALSKDDSVARQRRCAAALLPRLLRGDLDWIVLKALEKDRTRRYQAASELERDILRHLNDEPVQAGPPRLAYRVSKFVRRNRVAVTASMLVGTAVIVALLAALQGWMQASRARDELRIQRDHAQIAQAQAEEARQAESAQRRRAEESARRAELMSAFLRDMLASVNPTRARGREVTVLYLLNEAARRIAAGALAEQPDVEAGVRITLGETYEAVGAYAAAEGQYRAAAELLAAGGGDRDPQALRCRSRLVGVLNSLLRYEEAERIARDVAELQQQVLGDAHPDTLETRDRLGQALAGLGKLDDAEQVHASTLQAQRRALGFDHTASLRSQVNLAAVYHAQGRPAEAESLLRTVLTDMRRVLGEQHPDVMRAMNILARVLESERKFAAAEQLYRQSWELDKQVLGPDHPSTQLTMNNLLRVLQAQGRFEETRPLVATRLERLRAAAERPDATALAMNAYAWELLTCRPADLRDPEAARRIAERAVELDGRRDANLLETLALAYRETKDMARAIDTQRLAVQRARQGGPYNADEMERRLVEMLVQDGRVLEVASLQLGGMASQVAESLVQDYGSVGGTLLAQADEFSSRGEFEQAEPLLRAALAMRQKELPQDHWAVAQAKAALGQLLMRRERFAEAEQHLLDAYDVLSRDVRAPRALLQDTGRQIEELYLTWGRPDSLQRWRASIGPIGGTAP